MEYVFWVTGTHRMLGFLAWHLVMQEGMTEYCEYVVLPIVLREMDRVGVHYEMMLVEQVTQELLVKNTYTYTHSVSLSCPCCCWGHFLLNR